EELVLVLEVLRVVLEHDAVERLPARLVGREVVHVVAPGQVPRAPGVAGGTSRLREDVEVVRRLREVEQVAAVRVPREDAKAPRHRMSCGMSCGTRCGAHAAALESERTSFRTSRTDTPSAQGWPTGHSLCRHGRHSTSCASTL